MDYISVRNASERWKVSDRWTQKLCEKGRLEGVKRFGRSWVIPKDAGKPKMLIKNLNERYSIS